MNRTRNAAHRSPQKREREEEETYRLSVVPRKATVDVDGESGGKVDGGEP